MKKVVLSMLLLAGVSAFAASQSSGPINNPKELNKPTVGGRQSGSEQVFGNPQLIPGQKPDTNTTTDKNKATVGGRQSGSEQIFGNQPVTGQKGQKYNTSGVTKSKNKATVGGRQSGSEQVFGNP